MDDEVIMLEEGEFSAVGLPTETAKARGRKVSVGKATNAKASVTATPSASKEKAPGATAAKTVDTSVDATLAKASKKADRTVAGAIAQAKQDAEEIEAAAEKDSEDAKKATKKAVKEATKKTKKADSAQDSAAAAKGKDTSAGTDAAGKDEAAAKTTKGTSDEMLHSAYGSQHHMPWCQYPWGHCIGFSAPHCIVARLLARPSRAPVTQGHRTGALAPLAIVPRVTTCVITPEQGSQQYMSWYHDSCVHLPSLSAPYDNVPALMPTPDTAAPQERM